MSLYPNWLVIEGRRYKPETPRYRFAWDDEISDYGNKCRTQAEGFTGPDNPPAVIRFYKDMREGSDYRCNLTKDPAWKWQETIVQMNNADGGGLQRFNYWVNPNTAQFNTTGWAQMAYLGMSGNEVKILERAGEWVRFETLTPSDWMRARSMTNATHPHLIHSFSCVTWDAVNKVTKHIESTGTPRGKLFYPLVTNEGSAWIPARHIIERR
jgi:hypothetical protein